MTTPTDVMKQVVNYNLRNVNTSIPAEIISYDYTKQKANVQPLINKKYKDGTVESLPILTNVPVIFPRGGSFNMSWPINQGDTVLLIFSQRSIDLWLTTGGQVTPNDNRMFSISDAIAIPGLIPFNPDSGVEDNENFNINIGSARMKIGQDGTFCFHGLTDELMQVLTDLLIQLNLLASAPTPNPTVEGQIVLLQARLATLKGDC